MLNKKHTSRDLLEEVVWPRFHSNPEAVHVQREQPQPTQQPGTKSPDMRCLREIACQNGQCPFMSCCLHCLTERSELLPFIYSPRFYNHATLL